MRNAVEERLEHDSMRINHDKLRKSRISGIPRGLTITMVINH